MKLSVYLLLSVMLAAAFDSKAVLMEPDPADRVTEQRLRRLQAHFDVYREWLHRHTNLSDEQLLELQGVCEFEIRQSQISWLADPNRKPEPRLTDFAPIEFTNIGGAASCVQAYGSQQSVRQLLTPNQMEAMEIVVAERSEWLNAADTACLTAAVDERFLLSPDQWNALQQQMTFLLQSSGSRLTCFEKALCPLRIQGPVSIFPIIRKLDLSYGQHRQLQELNELLGHGQSTFPIEFFLVEGSAESSLQTVYRNFRDECRPIIDGAVLQLQKEWQISDSDADFLRLAGMGATTRYLDSWKHMHLEKVRQNIDGIQNRLLLLNEQQQMHDLVQITVNITIPPRSHEAIFTQSVWLRALQKVRPKGITDPEDRNRHRRHQAIVDFVTATLDRELWLRQPQRDSVRQLVESCLPVSVDTLRDPGRELVWLALPLVRLRPEQLANVLDEKQLAVWALLKDEYQFIEGTIRMVSSSGKEYLYLLPVAEE